MPSDAAPPPGPARGPARGPTEEPAPKPAPDVGAPTDRDGWLARELRGFGLVWLVSFVLILSANSLFIGFSGVLVALWAKLSRTPWREIGYVRPASWPRTVLGGLVFGAAFKLAMKAIVMPLLGADPVNHAYHYLSGNRAAIPGFLFAILFGAGFSEETVFRGYLFERFGRLLGRGVASKAVTVLVTSVWFGAEHYAVQGLAGAEQATVTGLVFGTIVAVTGRLPLVMVAHAAFDLTAYAITYRDLETTVAHWVFR